VRYVHKLILAMANLYLLKRGPTTSSKKNLGTVVEPFDNGWPEYEESFTMVQE
jgi:hypothetical protein